MDVLDWLAHCISATLLFWLIVGALIVSTGLGYKFFGAHGAVGGLLLWGGLWLYTSLKREVRRIKEEDDKELTKQGE